MSATRTWMLARLTGALIPPERAEQELDAYRDEVRVEDAAEIAALRSQVAGLLGERHSTNKALSDASEALRVQRDRISELEAAAKQAQALHVKFPDSSHCQRDGEQWPCSTVTHLQRPGGLAEQRHLIDPLDHALEALAPHSKPTAMVVTPSACRWCGIERREHFQQWKPPVGWHTWQAPTQEQTKARMRARREIRTTPNAGSAL